MHGLYCFCKHGRWRITSKAIPKDRTLLTYKCRTCNTVKYAIIEGVE